MVAAIILWREEPVCAVRDEVARDTEGKALAVCKHDGPLGHTQGYYFGGPIGSGDGAPILVDGFPDKVGSAERDREGTASVEDDGHGGGVGYVALGAEAGNEVRVERGCHRLEARGEDSGQGVRPIFPELRMAVQAGEIVEITKVATINWQEGHRRLGVVIVRRIGRRFRVAVVVEARGAVTGLRRRRERGPPVGVEKVKGSVQ